MQQFLRRQAPKKTGWGVAASAVAHALVIALLIFGLPLPEFATEQPEAIAVELVPPEPEVAQEEEEAAPEEAAEPAPQEPPPPPPQPPAEAEQVAAPPVQVLRPVVRFGEEDTGPEIAGEGDAPEEAAPEDSPAEEEPDAPAPGVAVPAEKPPVELNEARRLFSRAMTNDLVAMNAMGTMTRGERAGELCASELREQLRHAAQPYWPDLLPAYRLDKGTVMEVRRGAFRAGGQWYDLRLRCEIDADATRVVSFAFDVGAPVPRSEWKRRGFPDS